MRHENLGVSILSLSAYTVATAPDATKFKDSLILVSNGASGSRCLAVSDGSTWKQVAISASDITT